MREIRISIAVIIISLISVGIIFIYSSSGVYGLTELGDKAYFLKRHLLFLILGFFLMGLTMAIDYRHIRKAAKPLLLLSIFLLVLVLIPQIGQSGFGARRWFKLGVYHFQPSEFAKLAIMIYVADFLARKKIQINDFTRGFLPVILILVCICGLIVKQPDFGNALLVAFITLIMIFIAGARFSHIGFLMVLAAPVIYLLKANAKCSYQ